MEIKEFKRFRQRMNKTQRQMAKLLGTSNLIVPIGTGIMNLRHAYKPRI